VLREQYQVEFPVRGESPFWVATKPITAAAATAALTVPQSQ
jgi:hypothetical protein